MKKITLALIAAVSTVSLGIAQPNISIMAPPANSNSQLRLPNGATDHKSLKGCHLITASELTSLTGSVVNSIGFSLLDGASPASSGNFTIYLQNTGDATYNKGTSFTGALTGMTAHFTGVYNIPTSASASTVMFACTPAFTYTGGGIYVAYEWQETTPAVNTNSTNPATYNANFISGGGLCATSFTNAGLAPNTMTLSDFRACVIFSAVNTATNELSVDALFAPGITSKLAGAHQISALVKNASINAKTNVVVGLGVTGANTFVDTQTITNLPAGSTASVNFTLFNPTVSGVNNVSVGISPDQVNTNNSQTWTQSVTCAQAAAYNNFTAGSYTSQAYGAGGAAAGLIYAFKMKTTNASSLTGVGIVIPSFANAGNLGKQIFPVLLDASGNIVASSTTTLTIGTPDMDVWTTVKMTPPAPMTANTDYLVGFGLIGNGFFPVGVTPFTTSYFIPSYYSAPIAGGAPNLINVGQLSLSASLGFSNTMISAVASKSAVCNNVAPNTYPQSVTLTATGAAGTTYNWTSSTGQTFTTAVVVATPSIASVSGAIGYSVTGTEPVSGCKTNVANISVILSKCTGISNNGTFGSNINLYPNPVNGVSTIEGLVGENTLTVVNMLGQTVLTQVAKEESAKIDFSNLPAGNYFVKITDSNNDSAIIKVLNQK